MQRRERKAKWGHGANQGRSRRGRSEGQSCRGCEDRGVRREGEVPPRTWAKPNMQGCSAHLLNASKWNSVLLSTSSTLPPFHVSSASLASGRGASTGLEEHMRVPTSEPKLEGQRALGSHSLLSSVSEQDGPKPRLLSGP